MNNEKYNQIIDEAYKNYLKNGQQEADRNKEDQTFLPMPKQMFIDKIKTDNGFSNTWGLKIEERELDMMERWGLAGLTPNMTEFDYCNKLCDEHKVPTKLITITYNNETVEIYEMSIS